VQWRAHIAGSVITFCVCDPPLGLLRNPALPRGFIPLAIGAVHDSFLLSDCAANGNSRAYEAIKFLLEFQ
jgi:hypothetical protein